MRKWDEYLATSGQFFPEHLGSWKAPSSSFGLSGAFPFFLLLLALEAHDSNHPQNRPRGPSYTPICAMYVHAYKCVCIYIYILCLFHNIIYIYMDKSVFTLYLFQPTVSMPFACHYTRKKLKERIPFNPSLDPAASGFSTGVSSGFSSGSFSSTLQRDSRATLVRS